MGSLRTKKEYFISCKKRYFFYDFNRNDENLLF